jgi:hypothetical protein
MIATRTPINFSPPLPENPKHHSDIMKPARPKATHTTPRMIHTIVVGVSLSVNTSSMDFISLPSAFVDAGAGFGGGGGGIVPLGGRGISAEGAGLESGILYFTEEFQKSITGSHNASPVKNVGKRVCIPRIPVSQHVFCEKGNNCGYKQ